MIVAQGCNTGNDAKNERNSSHQETETEALETTQHFVFKSARGRLASQYKMNVTLEITLGLALISQENFIDSCYFTELTPNFVFFSKNRQEEFSWPSIKTSKTWQLQPNDDVTVVLELR
jgi:hypothetical protein